jgi:hypothetical protein
MVSIILWVMLAGCRCVDPPREPMSRPCAVDACAEAAVKGEDVPDAITRADAATDDGREGDVPPPPPWSDGGWRLPNLLTDAGVPASCEDLTPLTTWWHANDGTSICAYAGSIFIDAQSETFRYETSTQRSYLTLGRPTVEAGGKVRCSRSAVYAAVIDRTRHAAVIRFDRPDAVGSVIWTGNNGVPLDPKRTTGFFEFAVTDQVVAWIFLGGPRGPALYVAGPLGEDVGELTVNGGLPYDLRADGDHLVFVAEGDLWMYTRSTRALENLTHDDAAQWNPWISGDHLVWMDQRDNPGYDHWNPNNPEVYYMNLRDRAPVRITHDPPERPAHQYGPVTDGRWIVWADYRNNNTPNVMATDGEAQVYGYHLAERREQRLVGGRHRLYFPTIAAGDLYVACGAPVTGPSVNPPLGLHRMRLP